MMIFFWYYLFKTYLSLVTEKAIQTTLPILKKSLFESIEIIVPDVALQKQFAQTYSKVSNYLERFEDPLNENLFCSLSQKAFSGKL
ncbi:hypothetical protein FY553_06400 [Vibrio cholerae]|nr:hypothetical protein FY553_06400 [Vibrio cholerae]HDI3253266.1 restriction endonuclease subunit S [Vibrio cholerae]